MTIIPRFENSGFRLNPQVQRNLGPKTQFGFSPMPVLQSIMNPINSNKMVELAISDVMGMVVPRTIIDGSKRGVDSAREVFLREIMGTFILVYLSGSLLSTQLKFLDTPATNPKAMSLKAWIDTPLLEHFGKVTNQLLPKVKNTKELQQKFLETILGQLSSTDGAWKLPEYKSLFPSQGKLLPEIKKLITDTLMGRTQLPLGQLGNVDAEVKYFINQADYHKAAIAQLHQVETEKFLSSRGVQQLYQLSDRQKQRLSQIHRFREKELITKQSQNIRRLMTKGIRESEKPLIEYLTNAAVSSGGLSEKVILKNGRAQFFQLGQRSVEEVIRKLNYYLQEFMYPALTQNGKPMEQALTDLSRSRIRYNLFHNNGTSWLSKNFLVSKADGLIPYIYKMRRSMVAACLLLTFSFSYGFTYFNNWVTQRKYKGARFFPGEGVPKDLEHLKGGIF
jgi:hypothetical protein